MKFKIEYNKISIASADYFDIKVMDLASPRHLTPKEEVKCAGLAR